jgi:tetratricopeptide (TPR) repeat protein
MLSLKNLILLLVFGLSTIHVQVASKEISPEGFLSLGDEALSKDLSEKAVGLYQQGIEKLDEDESLLIELSLYTNMGSALSSMGKNEDAVKAYQKALVAYKVGVEDIVEKSFRKDAAGIAAQASFYLGMCYQDLGTFLDAVDAYAQAETLDPLHWGAAANLAAILHDSLSKPKEALAEYNKAFEILTQTDEEPTDAPPEPRYILSQLKYRMGLCISHDLEAKCALEETPDQEIPCKELATQAFSQALEYDPDNESARHMLATITADATMRRASNTYVKSLFDEYAQK